MFRRYNLFLILFLRFIPGGTSYVSRVYKLEIPNFGQNLISEFYPG